LLEFIYTDIGTYLLFMLSTLARCCISWFMLGLCPWTVDPTWGSTPRPHYRGFILVFGGLQLSSAGTEHMQWGRERETALSVVSRWKHVFK